MKPALGLLALLACGPALPCEGLSAEGAWVREPPPGMPMTAGYARLVNRSDKPITVVGVDGPDWASVTLHRTVVENGVSRMRPALPLSIEAGAQHVLEPGGYHLMLSRPGRELRPDDRVMIEFRCEERSTQLQFTVTADAP